MEIPVLIILAALIQYIGFSAVTGVARGKYNVPAPKTTGNENWERLYRIQQNTLEQLMVFIPAMFAFGWYVSEVWAIIPGITFIIGRQVYYYFYKSNPQKRGIGFILGFLSIVILIIGTLITLLNNVFLA